MEPQRVDGAPSRSSSSISSASSGASSRLSRARSLPRSRVSRGDEDNDDDDDEFAENRETENLVPFAAEGAGGIVSFNVETAGTAAGAGDASRDAHTPRAMDPRTATAELFNRWLVALISTLPGTTSASDEMDDAAAHSRAREADDGTGAALTRMFRLHTALRVLQRADDILQRHVRQLRAGQHQLDGYYRAYDYVDASTHRSPPALYTHVRDGKRRDTVQRYVAAESVAVNRLNALLFVMKKLEELEGTAGAYAHNTSSALPPHPTEHASGSRASSHRRDVRELHSAAERGGRARGRAPQTRTAAHAREMRRRRRIIGLPEDADGGHPPGHVHLHGDSDEDDNVDTPSHGPWRGDRADDTGALAPRPREAEPSSRRRGRHDSVFELVPTLDDPSHLVAVSGDRDGSPERPPHAHGMHNRLEEEKLIQGRGLTPPRTAVGAVSQAKLASTAAPLSAPSSKVSLSATQRCARRRGVESLSQLIHTLEDELVLPLPAAEVRSRLRNELLLSFSARVLSMRESRTGSFAGGTTGSSALAEDASDAAAAAEFIFPSSTTAAATASVTAAAGVPYPTPAPGAGGHSDAREDGSVVECNASVERLAASCDVSKTMAAVADSETEAFVEWYVREVVDPLTMSQLLTLVPPEYLVTIGCRLVHACVRAAAAADAVASTLAPSAAQTPLSRTLPDLTHVMLRAVRDGRPDALALMATASEQVAFHRARRRTESTLQLFFTVLLVGHLDVLERFVRLGYYHPQALHVLLFLHTDWSSDEFCRSYKSRLMAFIQQSVEAILHDDAVSALPSPRRATADGVGRDQKLHQDSLQDVARATLAALGGGRGHTNSPLAPAMDVAGDGAKQSGDWLADCNPRASSEGDASTASTTAGARDASHLPSQQPGSPSLVYGSAQRLRLLLQFRRVCLDLQGQQHRQNRAELIASALSVLARTADSGVDEVVCEESRQSPSSASVPQAAPAARSSESRKTDSLTGVRHVAQEEGGEKNDRDGDGDGVEYDDALGNATFTHLLRSKALDAVPLEPMAAAMTPSFSTPVLQRLGQRSYAPLNSTAYTGDGADAAVGQQSRPALMRADTGIPIQSCHESRWLRGVAGRATSFVFCADSCVEHDGVDDTAAHDADSAGEEHLSPVPHGPRANLTNSGVAPPISRAARRADELARKALARSYYYEAHLSLEYLLLQTHYQTSPLEDEDSAAAAAATCESSTAHSPPLTARENEVVVGWWAGRPADDSAGLAAGTHSVQQRRQRQRQEEDGTSSVDSAHHPRRAGPSCGVSFRLVERQRLSGAGGWNGSDREELTFQVICHRQQQEHTPTEEESAAGPSAPMAVTASSEHPRGGVCIQLSRSHPRLAAHDDDADDGSRGTYDAAHAVFTEISESSPEKRGAGVAANEGTRVFTPTHPPAAHASDTASVGASSLSDSAAPVAPARRAVTVYPVVHVVRSAEMGHGRDAHRRPSAVTTDQRMIARVENTAYAPSERQSGGLPQDASVPAAGPSVWAPPLYGAEGLAVGFLYDPEKDAVAVIVNGTPLGITFERASQPGAERTVAKEEEEAEESATRSLVASSSPSSPFTLGAMIYPAASLSCTRAVVDCLRMMSRPVAYRALSCETVSDEEQYSAPRDTPAVADALPCGVDVRLEPPRNGLCVLRFSFEEADMVFPSTAYHVGAHDTAVAPLTRIVTRASFLDGRYKLRQALSLLAPLPSPQNSSSSRSNGSAAREGLKGAADLSKQAYPAGAEEDEELDASPPSSSSPSSLTTQRTAMMLNLFSRGDPSDFLFFPPLFIRRRSDNTLADLLPTMGHVDGRRRVKEPLGLLRRPPGPRVASAADADGGRGVPIIAQGSRLTPLLAALAARRPDMALAIATHPLMNFYDEADEAVASRRQALLAAAALAYTPVVQVLVERMCVVELLDAFGVRVQHRTARKLRREHRQRNLTFLESLQRGVRPPADVVCSHVPSASGPSHSYVLNAVAAAAWASATPASTAAAGHSPSESVLDPARLYYAHRLEHTPLHCALLGCTSRGEQQEALDAGRDATSAAGPSEKNRCVTVLLNFLCTALEPAESARRQQRRLQVEQARRARVGHGTIIYEEDNESRSTARQSSEQHGAATVAAASGKHPRDNGRAPGSLLHAALNAVTRAGESALMIAVQHRNVPVALRLLRLGANPTCVDRLSRATSLEVACANRCSALAGALLDCEAYHRSPVLINHVGVATPLCWCALNNLPKLVPRLLRAGADPRIGLDEGGSPLLLAVAFGSEASALALLEALRCSREPHAKADAGVGAPGSMKPNAPLTSVLPTGGSGNGVELVSHATATSTTAQFIDVDAMDPRTHCTPLHLAAELGQLAVVRALLQLGASLSAVTRPAYHTPLHTALLSGYEDVAMAMLSYGKDQLRATGSVVLDIAAVNAVGDTALHVAARCGQSQVVEYILAQYRASEMRRLMAFCSGAEQHPRHDGAALRAMAASWEQVPEVPYHAVNHAGRTPLLAAIQTGATDTALQLVTFAMEEFDARDGADARSMRARSRTEEVGDAVDGTARASVSSAGDGAAVCSAVTGGNGGGGAVIDGTCTALLQASPNERLNDVVLAMLAAPAVFPASVAFREAFLRDYTARRRHFTELDGERGGTGSEDDECDRSARGSRSPSAGAIAASSRASCSYGPSRHDHGSAPVVALLPGPSSPGAMAMHTVGAARLSISAGFGESFTTRVVPSRARGEGGSSVHRSRTGAASVRAGRSRVALPSAAAEALSRAGPLPQHHRRRRSSYVRLLRARGRSDADPAVALQELLRGFALPELYVMLEAVAAESAIVGIQNPTAMMYGELLVGFLQEHAGGGGMTVAPARVVRFCQQVLKGLKQALAEAAAATGEAPTWMARTAELSTAMRHCPSFCHEILRAIRLYGCGRGEHAQGSVGYSLARPRVIDEMEVIVSAHQDREVSGRPRRPEMPSFVARRQTTASGGEGEENGTGDAAAAAATASASPQTADAAVTGHHAARDAAASPAERQLTESSFESPFGYTALQLCAALRLPVVADYLITKFHLSPTYVPAQAALASPLHAAKLLVSPAEGLRAPASVITATDRQWLLTPFRLAVRSLSAPTVHRMLTAMESAGPSTCEISPSSLTALESVSAAPRPVVDCVESAVVDPAQRTALQEVLAESSPMALGGSTGDLEGLHAAAALMPSGGRPEAAEALGGDAGRRVAENGSGDSSTAPVLQVARVLLQHGAAVHGHFDANGLDAWLTAVSMDGAAGDRACRLLLSSTLPNCMAQLSGTEDSSSSSSMACVSDADAPVELFCSSSALINSLWDSATRGCSDDAEAVRRHLAELDEQWARQGYGVSQYRSNAAAEAAAVGVDPLTSEVRDTGDAGPTTPLTSYSPRSCSSLSSVPPDRLTANGRAGAAWLLRRYLSRMLFACAEHNAAHLPAVLQLLLTPLPPASASPPAHRTSPRKLLKPQEQSRLQDYVLTITHPLSGDTLLTLLLRRARSCYLLLGGASTGPDVSEEASGRAVAPSRCTDECAASDSAPGDSELFSPFARGASVDALTLPAARLLIEVAVRVARLVAEQGGRVPPAWAPHASPLAADLLSDDTSPAAAARVPAGTTLDDLLYQVSQDGESALSLAAHMGCLPLIAFIVCPPAVRTAPQRSSLSLAAPSASPPADMLGLSPASFSFPTQTERRGVHSAGAGAGSRAAPPPASKAARRSRAAHAASAMALPTPSRARRIAENLLSSVVRTLLATRVYYSEDYARVLYTLLFCIPGDAERLAFLRLVYPNVHPLPALQLAAENVSSVQGFLLGSPQGVNAFWANLLYAQFIARLSDLPVTTETWSALLRALLPSAPAAAVYLIRKGSLEMSTSADRQRRRRHELRQSRASIAQGLLATATQQSSRYLPPIPLRDDLMAREEASESVATDAREEASKSAVHPGARRSTSSKSAATAAHKKEKVKRSTWENMMRWTHTFLQLTAFSVAHSLLMPPRAGPPSPRSTPARRVPADGSSDKSAPAKASLPATTAPPPLAASAVPAVSLQASNAPLPSSPSSPPGVADTLLADVLELAVRYDNVELFRELSRLRVPPAYFTAVSDAAVPATVGVRAGGGAAVTAVRPASTLTLPTLRACCPSLAAARTLPQAKALLQRLQDALDRDLVEGIRVDILAVIAGSPRVLDAVLNAPNLAQSSPAGLNDTREAAPGDEYQPHSRLPRLATALRYDCVDASTGLPEGVHEATTMAPGNVSPWEAVATVTAAAAAASRSAPVAAVAGIKQRSQTTGAVRLKIPQPLPRRPLLENSTLQMENSVSNHIVNTATTTTSSSSPRQRQGRAPSLGSLQSASISSAGRAGAPQHEADFAADEQSLAHRTDSARVESNAGRNTRDRDGDDEEDDDDDDDFAKGCLNSPTQLRMDGEAADATSPAEPSSDAAAATEVAAVARRTSTAEASVNGEEEKEAEGRVQQSLFSAKRHGVAEGPVTWGIGAATRVVTGDSGGAAAVGLPSAWHTARAAPRTAVIRFSSLVGADTAGRADGAARKNRHEEEAEERDDDDDRNNHATDKALGAMVQAARLPSAPVVPSSSAPSLAPSSPPLPLVTAQASAPQPFMYLLTDWALHAMLTLQSPQPAASSVAVILLLLGHRVPLSVSVVQLFLAASRSAHSICYDQAVPLTSDAGRRSRAAIRAGGAAPAASTVRRRRLSLTYCTAAHGDTLLHLLVLNDQCQLAEYFLAFCLYHFSQLDAGGASGDGAVCTSHHCNDVDSSNGNGDGSGRGILYRKQPSFPRLYLRLMLRLNRHGLTAFDYAHSAGMVQLLSAYGCVPPPYRPELCSLSRTLGLPNSEAASRWVADQLDGAAQSVRQFCLHTPFFPVPRLVLATENFAGLLDGPANAAAVDQAVWLSLAMRAGQKGMRPSTAATRASIARPARVSTARHASASAPAAAVGGGGRHSARASVQALRPDGRPAPARAAAPASARANAALLRNVLAAQRTTGSLILPVLLNEDVSLLHLGLCAADDELVQRYGHSASSSPPPRRSGSVKDADDADDDGDDAAATTAAPSAIDRIDRVLTGAHSGRRVGSAAASGAEKDARSSWTAAALPAAGSATAAQARPLTAIATRPSAPALSGLGRALLPTLVTAGSAEDEQQSQLSRVRPPTSLPRAVTAATTATTTAAAAAAAGAGVPDMSFRGIVSMLEKHAFVVVPLSLPPDAASRSAPGAVTTPWATAASCRPLPVPDGILVAASASSATSTSRKTRGGSARRHCSPAAALAAVDSVSAFLYKVSAAAHAGPAASCVAASDDASEAALMVALTPMQLAIGAGQMPLTQKGAAEAAASQFCSRLCPVDGASTDGVPSAVVVRASARTNVMSFTADGAVGKAGGCAGLADALDEWVDGNMRRLLREGAVHGAAAVSRRRSANGSSNGAASRAAFCVAVDEAHEARPNDGSKHAPPEVLAARAASSTLDGPSPQVCRADGSPVDESDRPASAAAPAARAHSRESHAASKQQSFCSQDSGAESAQQTQGSVAPVRGVATAEQQALMRLLIRQFTGHCAGARGRSAAVREAAGVAQVAKELGLRVEPNYDVDRAGDAVAAVRGLKSGPAAVAYSNTL